jgi:pimeloyl-ACP methyl ester carboxylesterase
MLVREHVPRLAGAIRALAGERAPVIVAHSMGGWIAQMLIASADAPPMEAAVLVTPVPAAGVPIGTSAKILFQYPLSFARANFLLSVPIKDTRMARRLFHMPGKPEAEVAASHAKLVPESALSCLDMVLGISRVKARPARVPTLVISAEHDYFFPPACEKRLAEGLRADYLEYKGMAHNVMEDARWREVARAIEGWIEARAVGRGSATAGTAL